jgi:hypothetical protein
LLSELERQATEYYALVDTLWTGDAGRAVASNPQAVLMVHIWRQSPPCSVDQIGVRKAAVDRILNRNAGPIAQRAGFVPERAEFTQVQEIVQWSHTQGAPLYVALSALKEICNNAPRSGAAPGAKTMEQAYQAMTADQATRDLLKVIAAVEKNIRQQLERAVEAALMSQKDVLGEHVERVAKAEAAALVAESKERVAAAEKRAAEAERRAVEAEAELRRIQARIDRVRRYEDLKQSADYRELMRPFFVREANGEPKLSLSGIRSPNDWLAPNNGKLNEWQQLMGGPNDLARSQRAGRYIEEYGDLMVNDGSLRK